MRTGVDPTAFLDLGIQCPSMVTLSDEAVGAVRVRSSTSAGALGERPLVALRTPAR